MHQFILALFSVFTLTHHELADEPAGPITHQSPAAVHVRYEALGGYQAVTFWQGLGIGPYVGSFNHLWCDDYPFWRSYSDGLGEWAQTVKRCVAAARRYHLPRPLMVGQAFGGLDGGEGAIWRCPTLREHRRMIQLARRLGAGGILWWRPNTPANWCPTR